MLQQGGAGTAAVDILSPQSLRVLVVDSKASARQEVTALLRKCSYQVMEVKSTAEALQLLKDQQARDGAPGVDLILKEHDPPAANACRLLRRTLEDDVLRTVPVVGPEMGLVPRYPDEGGLLNTKRDWDARARVMSSQEDRDVMVACLQLGAADYMIRPLRHNELRNLWARVYWWRRAFYLQQQATHALGGKEHSLPGLKLRYYPSLSQSSDESEETKRSQQALKPVNREEMERSGEGSAPNGSGNGGANGSGNCSKDGHGNSRVNPGSRANGNGNSATKQCEGSNQPNGESGNNGNGNSATKADNLGTGNGNSGNDASTSRQEVAALQGTAQGGKRYRLTEELGAELRSAAEEQGIGAEMQPQHAPLKQRPADGARPAKAYRGEYSRVEVGNENDNGVGLVGSTTAMAGSLPGSGSRQDSKPNVTNGGDGSSGQDTGNGNGAVTANGNGGSTAHRLDLPSTAEGAQAGGPLQSARMAEVGGFRAYISPAHKRKASEIAMLAETPVSRAGSGHLARNAVGAVTDCAEVGSMATAGGQASNTLGLQGMGSTPTSQSEDTRMLASGGSGKDLPPRLGSGSGSLDQVQWPHNAGAQMQQRLQVTAQRQNSGGVSQLPGYRGPGSFNYFGMPPPNFGMPGPFWPQMPNPMGQMSGQPSGQGSAQGSFQEGNPNFDAFYGPFGAQHMAAAMAAAAGAASAGNHEMEAAAQQQQQQQQQQQHQQFAFMLQQQQAQQQQMFLQQYGMAANNMMQHMAAGAGSWQQSGRGQPSSPNAAAAAQFAAAFPFGNPGGSAGPRSVQSYPTHPMAARGGPMLQYAAARAAVAAAAGSNVRQGSMHSAPAGAAGAGGQTNNGVGVNNGATSRAPPGFHQGASGKQANGANDGDMQGVKGEPGADLANGNATAATGKERRMQALHKYKQKRKNLCFTKKIRYESRKQLAQARPRVKGQFVRMATEAADADGGIAAEADAVEMLGDLPNLGTATDAVLAAAKAAAEEEGMEFQDEDDTVDNDELGKDDGAAKWQAGAAQALEEDDEENVVNSPQDISTRVPGPASTSHGHHSGSRLQSHGIAVHPHSGANRIASPVVASNAHNKSARNGNGSSDSGSNSPDIKDGAGDSPEADMEQ